MTSTKTIFSPGKPFKLLTSITLIIYQLTEKIFRLNVQHIIYSSSSRSIHSMLVNGENLFGFFQNINRSLLILEYIPPCSFPSVLFLLHKVSAPMDYLSGFFYQRFCVETHWRRPGWPPPSSTQTQGGESLKFLLRDLFSTILLNFVIKIFKI